MTQLLPRKRSTVISLGIVPIFFMEVILNNLVRGSMHKFVRNVKNTNISMYLVIAFQNSSRDSLHNLTNTNTK